MKVFLILASLAFSTTVLAACPDLSGTYKQIYADGNYDIDTIKQDACLKISVDTVGFDDKGVQKSTSQAELIADATSRPVSANYAVAYSFSDAALHVKGLLKGRDGAQYTIEGTMSLTDKKDIVFQLIAKDSTGTVVGKDKASLIRQ